MRRTLRIRDPARKPESQICQLTIELLTLRRVLCIRLFSPQDPGLTNKNPKKCSAIQAGQK